jgi:N utilization substance protein B
MNIKAKSFIKDRRTARILAFQALFSYGFEEHPVEQLLTFSWVDGEITVEALQYAASLVSGTMRHIVDIDKRIRDHLRNWDFSRISYVDKAVLRFSIYSLLHENDVPVKVVINEAVEIVKLFGGEDSYKFVNGLLDAVKRTKKQG